MRDSNRIGCERIMRFLVLIVLNLVIIKNWTESTNVLEDIDSTNAFNLTNGCNYVDILYDKKNFDQLKNCQVVLNGLKISNISENLNDLNFPDLWEITGYLIISNVQNLNSLQNLFPNLAVIRGEILIHGSAVMITNNSNLENIGLKRLSYIERGDVTIFNNPKLCYVDTVDWNKIFQKNDTQSCHSVSLFINLLMWESPLITFYYFYL